MLARRLLMAGGGSFTSFVRFEAAASPEGGWVWFVDPRAVAYNGTTYWGYVNGGGDVTARSTVNATRVTNTLIPGNRLHAAFQVDDHDPPGIIVRNSDHRLLYFWSGHLGATPYLRISTNPEDISAFGAETALDSQIGGNLYSYMNPCQLSGESNAIYLFFRDHVGGSDAAPDWGYSKSTDGGATWASEVDLVQTTYARISDNGTDRIDLIASEHPNDTDRHEHSIWHAYYAGGAWHKTDGTVISASRPFATSTMTKVYDGATTYGWVWDVALDPATGYPVCTYVTFPGNDGSSHLYKYAAWNGSAWTSHQIVDGGGHFPSGSGPGEEFYSGGVNLDHEDPRIVYASVGVGSGVWEVRRYATADSGATWSSVTLSTTSSKNIRPVAVRAHGSAIAVLWLDGTYTDYTSFSVGTRGA